MKYDTAARKGESVYVLYDSILYITRDQPFEKISARPVLLVNPGPLKIKKLLVRDIGMNLTYLALNNEINQRFRLVMFQDQLIQLYANLREYRRQNSAELGKVLPYVGIHIRRLI